MEKLPWHNFQEGFQAYFFKIFFREMTQLFFEIWRENTTIWVLTKFDEIILKFTAQYWVVTIRISSLAILILRWKIENVW